MEYRRITTTNDWRELWLNKFIAELKKRELPEKDQKSYYSIIERFLEKNPGNPRAIGIEGMIKFIGRRNLDAIAALHLFYDAIAHSEKHLAGLEEIHKKNDKKHKGKRKRGS